MKKPLRGACHRVNKSAVGTTTGSECHRVHQAIPGQPCPERRDLNPRRPKGKRGRIANSDAHNLDDRLAKHLDSVLRFMSDPNGSFTNNTGEQKNRMAKIKILGVRVFSDPAPRRGQAPDLELSQPKAATRCNPLAAIHIARAGGPPDMIKLHYAKSTPKRG